MKYLILSGGLGNQMFEFAFLLALRNKGFKVIMDISYYDYLRMHNGYELKDVFGIDELCIDRQGMHIFMLRFLNKYRPSSLYMADKLYFEPQSLQKPRKYIFGYWQDELYFKDIADQVRKVFTFRSIDDYNKKISQEMMEKNSVSLHIRRGDYASYGMTIIDEDYYRLAVEEIKSRVESPYFYVFSDDNTAAKTIAESLHLNYELISHNRGKDSYKDMYLMSQCKHNIVANSSFSWWGAWLNNNEGKIVVAPHVWSHKNHRINPQASSWILV